MSEDEVITKQEALNKRNINALAVSEKEKNQRLQKVEEELVNLKRLVTNLTVEVQGLRTQIHIQKTVGPTA